jgi:cellobiose phosphorylase
LFQEEKKMVQLLERTRCATRTGRAAPNEVNVPLMIAQLLQRKGLQQLAPFVRWDDQNRKIVFDAVPMQGYSVPKAPRDTKKGQVAPFLVWDDARRKLIFDPARIPGPWANYLGTNNEKGFTGMTWESAGGAWADADAGLSRVSAYDPQAQEVGGRGVYIKDMASGQVFSPAFRPVRNRLVRRETTHGLGHEINRATFNDRKGTSYEVQQTIFIDPEDAVELHETQIKNTGKTRKTVWITNVDEFGGLDAAQKWGNRQRHLSVEHGKTVRRKGETTTYVHPNYEHGPWSDVVFFTTYETANRTWNDLDEFTGKDGTRQTPRAVMDDDYQVKNHPIYGGDAIAATEVEITLEPGETRTIRSIVGHVRNPRDKKFVHDKNGKEVVDLRQAEELIAKYAAPTAFAESFIRLREAWEKQLFNLQVETCNDKFNRMINTWLQYQADIVRSVSRSASRFESWLGRGLGFRDSLQDILGYVHSSPEKARARIIELLGCMFPDGGAFHNFQPKTKEGNAAVGGDFNDDQGWTVLAVYAYLAETGDYSILNEKVKFSADPNKPKPTKEQLAETSVMDHLKRAMAHMYKNKGPHGLPLIGHADWNDCLNLGLEDDEAKGADYMSKGYQCGKQKKTKAESLMIAGLFIKAAQQFAQICDEVGDKKEAAKIRQERNKMIGTVKKHGWDGKWFRRAYDQDGLPVGSKTRPEVGKIWIESQGWLGMAGVGAKMGWTQKAMDSVDKYLASPWGLALLYPAIHRFNPKMGEVSAYLKGLKEGGGVFSHNNPWVAIAMIGLGTKKGINRGYEIMTQIAPWFFTPERLMQYKCETIAFAQMVGGPEAAKHVRGQAKNSMTTGTAAWATVAFVEKMLGLQRGLKGMTIDPSLPDKLISRNKPIKIQRKYRGDILHISIENPDKVNRGVKEMYVDGVKVASKLIKPFKDGKEHTVRVVMGKEPVRHKGHTVREEEKLAA